MPRLRQACGAVRQEPCGGDRHRYNIPLTAQLPIDPKLAAGIDKGMIELFNGDWLDKIADAVYELPARAGK